MSKEDIANMKKVTDQIPLRMVQRIQDASANHLYGGTLKIKRVFTAQKDYDYINEDNPGNSNKVKSRTMASLDYYAHTSDMKILDYIFEGVDKIPKVQITRTEVPTYEIEYKRNPVCAICKNSCCEMYLKATEKMRMKRKTILQKRRVTRLLAKESLKKMANEEKKETIIKNIYNYE